MADGSDARGDDRIAPSDQGGPDRAIVTAGTYLVPIGPVPHDSATARAEIEAGIGRRDAVSISHVGEAVYLSLRPGRERIADLLKARFGEMVRVDVGGIVWPMDDAVEEFDRGEPLEAAERVDGLSATFIPDADRVGLGEPVTGSVVLTNTTAEAVTVQWTGAGARAHLVRPGTLDAVGVFRGMETLQFTQKEVPAGAQSGPIPMVVGITSRTPRIGTAVQPGRYDLIAVLALADGRSLQSEPAEIIVSMS